MPIDDRRISYCIPKEKVEMYKEGDVFDIIVIKNDDGFATITVKINTRQNESHMIRKWWTETKKIVAFDQKGDRTYFIAVADDNDMHDPDKIAVYAVKTANFSGVVINGKYSYFNIRSSNFARVVMVVWCLLRDCDVSLSNLILSS